MNPKLKSGLKYLSGFLAGAVLVALCMLNFDFEGASQADIICCWSDAFSSTGVMMILIGLLIWVSNEGAFNGIGYALSVAFKGLIPGGRAKRMETYADYLDRKEQKRITGFGFLIIVGAVYLAVGLVFMVIFNQM